MADIITPVGKTVVVACGTAAANVANVATNTTTFHITNGSSTVYAYVGVFKTYAEAVAMDHPSAGTDGFGAILTPNESMSIQGNFGLPSTQTMVYVAGITSTGNTNIYATPIAE